MVNNNFNEAHNDEKKIKNNLKEYFLSRKRNFMEYLYGIPEETIRKQKFFLKRRKTL
jgi:hypothetical protein